MSAVTTPSEGRVKRTRVIPTQPRRWRSVTINLYVYAVLVIALFLGTVQVAQRVGFWSVSGKLTASGEKIQVTGADPNEIKGWMKISDVLTSYNVPQAEFYAKFGIPADLSVDAGLKDIEKVAPSFSVSALRTWLAQRQGR